MFRSRIILTAIAAQLLCGCLFDFGKKEETADKGGGTEVVGRLFLPDGETPAEGARVELREVSEDPLNKSLAKSSAVPLVDFFITGKDGKFNFSQLAPGTYNLKASIELNGKTLVGMIRNLEYESKLLELETLILRAPGAVEMEVLVNSANTADVKCYIPGITGISSSDIQGISTLAELAEGEYTVRCSYPGYLSRDFTVSIFPDSVTRLENKSLQADPSGPPPAPSGLSAQSERQSGTVLLTWNDVDVEDLNGYIVQRKEDGAPLFTALHSSIPVKGQGYQDTVYKEGSAWKEKTIIYRVAAQDTSGSTGGWSQTATVTVLPPNRPASPLPAHQASELALSITLAWSTVSPKSAEDIVVYTVLVDTVSEPALVMSRAQSGNVLSLTGLEENTTYYWQVIATSGSEEIAGPVWSFKTVANVPGNTPPEKPSGPAPAHEATGQDPNSLMLSWNGGDQDTADVVEYDVYLGTQNPPVIKISQAHLETSVQTSGLLNSTDYYWQVIATDGKSTEAGPVWKFKTRGIGSQNTPPAIPADPTPLDSAIKQNLVITLMWRGGDPDEGDIVTYEVFLGTQSVPSASVASGLSEPRLPLDILQENTTYYWKVVSSDNQGANTQGPVWQFTTKQSSPENLPPNIPNQPDPAFGDTVRDLSIPLSWIGGDPDGDEVFYDVFLRIKSQPSRKIVSGKTETSTPVQILNPGTTYLWYVVASDSQNTVTGPTWEFVTMPEDISNQPPNIPELISPASGDTGLEIPVQLSWTGGDPDSADNVLYTIYVDVINPPVSSASIEQTGTSLELASLVKGQKYYWSVKASDGKSTVGSAIRAFTTKPQDMPNNAPDSPSSPVPEDAVTGTPITLTLSWTGGDPDGDDVVYEVFLGTSQNPTVSRGQTLSAGMQISGLAENTTYYWRVSASDGRLSTLGPVWSFTTQFSPKIVGHWNFNEAVGTTAADASGYGSTAYLREAMWYMGIEGTAVKFNNAGYVAIPVSQVLKLESFTISLWIQSFGTEPMTIFTYAENGGGVDNVGMHLWLNTGESPSGNAGAVAANLLSAAPPYDRIISTDPGLLSATGFHHVVTLFDAASGMASIYIDGQEASGVQLEPGAAITGLDTLYLGWTPQFVNRETAGNTSHLVLDELTMFNYVLDASQVQALFQQNENLAPNVPANPVPAVGAVLPGTEVTLRWDGGDPDLDVVTYKILLDTVTPPVNTLKQLMGLTEYQLSLKGGITYYWRVEAMDAQLKVMGPVWNFSTTNSAPNLPSGPGPLDNAGKVALPITLTWSGGDRDTMDDVGYRIDMGTGLANLAEAGTVMNHTAFTPEGLWHGTAYLWQITASDGRAVTQGPVWRFTTAMHDTLVAYWKCNNQGGGSTASNLRDETRFRNDGAITNGTFPPSFDGSTGLYFNGNTSVNVPMSYSLEMAGFSISFWVRQSAFWLPQPVITFGRDGLQSAGGVQIILNSMGDANEAPNNVFVNIPDSEGRPRITYTGTNTLTDGWNQVTVTFSSETGDAAIYINGERKQGDELTPGAALLGSDMYMGRYPPNIAMPGDSPNLTATLDEIEIYNYPITEVKVITDFEARRPN